MNERIEDINARPWLPSWHTRLVKLKLELAARADGQYRRLNALRPFETEQTVHRHDIHEADEAINRPEGESND